MKLLLEFASRSHRKTCTNLPLEDWPLGATEHIQSSGLCSVTPQTPVTVCFTCSAPMSFDKRPCCDNNDCSRRQGRLNPNSEVGGKVKRNHAAVSMGESNFGEVGRGQYKRLLKSG